MQIHRADKPWGYEIWWAHTDKYVGKLLHIREGHRLSLQFHERKDETIYLQSGSLLLLLDEGHGLFELQMLPGESRRIEPGMKHRMIALSDCVVLEASTPEVDDVVRIDDAYGRVG